MDTPYTRKEKIIGTILIVIGIISLITLLVIGRGKDWFRKYVTYYTIFDESYNLSDDAAVKIYNADIGKVKDITLVEDKVKVELKILEDYKYRIKTDSVAVVRNAAFFYGTEYIAIKPGSPDAGFLPDGSEIPSEPRKSIEALLNEYGIQDTAKRIIDIFRDIGDIIKQLRDPEGALASTLHHVGITASHAEGITRDIEEGKGTAGQLFKSTELIESILGGFENLGGVFADIKETSTNTPEMVDQVRDNLIKLKTILDDVFESVSSVKKTLMEAETASHEIPAVVQSARQDIQGMRDALENADKIIWSLQNNILIRSNLPPESEGEITDAGLRR